MNLGEQMDEQEKLAAWRATQPTCDMPHPHGGPACTDLAGHGGPYGSAHSNGSVFYWLSPDQRSGS